MSTVAVSDNILKYMLTIALTPAFNEYPFARVMSRARSVDLGGDLAGASAGVEFRVGGAAAGTTAYPNNDGSGNYTNWGNTGSTRQNPQTFRITPSEIQYRAQTEQGTLMRSKLQRMSNTGGFPFYVDVDQQALQEAGLTHLNDIVFIHTGTGYVANKSQVISINGANTSVSITTTGPTTIKVPNVKAFRQNNEIEIHNATTGALKSVNGSTPIYGIVTAVNGQAGEGTITVTWASTPAGTNPNFTLAAGDLITPKNQSAGTSAFEGLRHSVSNVTPYPYAGILNNAGVNDTRFRAYVQATTDDMSPQLLVNFLHAASSRVGYNRANTLNTSMATGPYVVTPDGKQVLRTNSAILLSNPIVNQAMKVWVLNNTQIVREVAGSTGVKTYENGLEVETFDGVPWVCCPSVNPADIYHLQPESFGRAMAFEFAVPEGRLPGWNPIPGTTLYEMTRFSAGVFHVSEDRSVNSVMTRTATPGYPSWAVDPNTNTAGTAAEKRFGDSVIFNVPN